MDSIKVTRSPWNPVETKQSLRRISHVGTMIKWHVSNHEQRQRTLIGLLVTHSLMSSVWSQSRGILKNKGERGEIRKLQPQAYRTRPVGPSRFKEPWMYWKIQLLRPSQLTSNSNGDATALSVWHWHWHWSSTATLFILPRHLLDRMDRPQ